MIEELRQRLRGLEKPPGLEDGPAALPLGAAAVDRVLGGGLMRGALHEIAALGEAHAAAATGFVAGVAALAALSSPSPRLQGEGWGEGAFPKAQTCGEAPPPPEGGGAATPPPGGGGAPRPAPTPPPPGGGGVGGAAAAFPKAQTCGEAPSPGSLRDPTSPRTAGRGKHLVWVAEDMAALESGALHGAGLDGFGVRPERLVTVSVAQRRDLLWTMEEALRCRAVSCVIGEMRHGALDAVAVRRLSLAAAETAALALILRAGPGDDASTAATRWIVSAAAAESAEPRMLAQLVRNRRGPRGQWILEWSDSDGRFTCAAHAQPVALPPRHRPHQKIARSVA